MSVEFGREICGDLRTASTREWLVTNGIGGFAAGTISGVLTRRYHGLLIAALRPPLGRTLLCSHLDETTQVGATSYPLSSSRWASGSTTGHGHRHLEHFALDGRIPTWTYALGDALLEKRIFMPRQRNTTCVQYLLRRGSADGSPVTLRIKAQVNYRDYHGETHARDWAMRVEALPTGDGLRVLAYRDATPLTLRAEQSRVMPAHIWYRDYLLAHEQERGFTGHEDHLHVGEFILTLVPGQAACVVASAGDPVESYGDGTALWTSLRAYDRSLLTTAAMTAAPAAVQQLVLAADSFIVRRALPVPPADPDSAPPTATEHALSASDFTDGDGIGSAMSPVGHSILAGYPWFSDWGRDSMISLPGLTLLCGRPHIARSLLLTYARHVDHGMIPNRFPDADQTPEYNTADATLWLVEATRAYFAATGDRDLVRQLWPTLGEILAWHLRGTRHAIHCDPSDGLLYAGEPGVQLTWMDAKVDGWVVTPRIGKPVEINALWYNALCVLADLAGVLGLTQEQGPLQTRARLVRDSFARFYSPRHGYLLDVLDGRSASAATEAETAAPTDDASLRPNQIFAVSLPHSPLSTPQQQAVVRACAQHLYTPRGLRSLAPSDASYVGTYSGDVRSRDGAYHQGTVWGWLLGPFALAHHRAFGDAEAARAFLLPMLDHLAEAGLGTISEIFDGDAPFVPRGCPAQAWSVAEWLRAWHALRPPSRP